MVGIYRIRAAGTGGLLDVATMIKWLDFLLFGNGHGLGAPTFNQAFYYLDGDFYTWFGGFGAQLQSFGWLTPPPGTRRIICGKEFVVFSVHRSFLRVQISWATTEKIKDYSDIAKLKAHLLESG